MKIGTENQGKVPRVSLVWPLFKKCIYAVPYTISLFFKLNALVAAMTGDYWALDKSEESQIGTR